MIAFVFGVPPAYEIMANFSGLHMDSWGEMEMVGTLMDRDIEMVAKALGHSDSRITRKHYAQYLPNEVAQAVAKLPALGIAAHPRVDRLGDRLRR